jgi:hypothetical protein
VFAPDAAQVLLTAPQENPAQAKLGRATLES